MPLDVSIIIGEQTVQTVPIHIDDYDFIISRIERDDRFKLLSETIADYYSDSELAPMKLVQFNQELSTFCSLYDSEFSPVISALMSDLQELVERAIKFQLPIRLLAD